jgi:hypothetical protein
VNVDKSALQIRYADIRREPRGYVDKILAVTNFQHQLPTLIPNDSTSPDGPGLG